MIRASLFLATLALGGCQPTIYLRDGVTDGDTFFLAPVAYASDDPAIASWVRYSLMLSTCQLQLDGDVPSRNSSYECELKARQHLVEAWQEHRDRGQKVDPYLDTLVKVDIAGFLPHYTAHYLERPPPSALAEIDADAFARWRRENLSRHRPQTRLIGHWGYRRQVDAAY